MLAGAKDNDSYMNKLNAITMAGYLVTAKLKNFAYRPTSYIKAAG